MSQADFAREWRSDYDPTSWPAPLMTKLRLFWVDARNLRVYLLGTAAIAIWIKFAIDVIHWRATGVWLR